MRNNKCRRECGEIGTLIHCGELVTQCIHFDSSSELYTVTILTCNSAPYKYTPKGNENISAHKNLRKNDHCRSIPNSLNVDITHQLMNG